MKYDISIPPRAFRGKEPQHVPGRDPTFFPAGDCVFFPGKGLRDLEFDDKLVSDQPREKSEESSMDYPVEKLLETKFLNVYDLQYAPGRHYFTATRRKRENMVAEMDAEAFSRMMPDAVSCCVVWHEEGKAPRIVLNREYRYPLGQFVTSVPAGLIDPEDQGMSTEDAVFTAARREIMEETGLTLTERDRVTMINPCLFSSPGITDESNAMVRIDLYGHRSEELTQGNADVTEKFDGFILAEREEALELMARGKISVYTWIGLSVFVQNPE